MDNRAEVKAFLSSRRAKITPEQAGLIAYARNRRVPGLRCSEVADLAGVSVAQLRTEAGRNPYDKALSDLVGELCTRSDAFRGRWAAHDVRLHLTGSKHFHHPVVGELQLNFEVLELPADPGLALIAFSAEAGSPDDDALKLLASWAATHQPADAVTPPHQM